MLKKILKFKTVVGLVMIVTMLAAPAWACVTVRQTAQINVKHNITNGTIIQDSVSLEMKTAPVPIFVTVGHTCHSFTPAFTPVPGCYAPTVIRSRTWRPYLEVKKTNTFQYKYDTSRWIRVVSNLKGHANGVFTASSYCDMDSISSQLYYCDLSIR